jgi:hypothetical protein
MERGEGVIDKEVDRLKLFDKVRKDGLADVLQMKKMVLNSHHEVSIQPHLYPPYRQETTLFV